MVLRRNSPVLVVCQTLSIFCGLGMHNGQLHRNRERLLVQYKVSFDSLLFYSSPLTADVEELLVRLHSRTS